VSPSRIAARVRRIKPSPSTSAADRANELRRQGKSIVNLVVGEPDFDTPAHIRAAAAAAMDKGQTRYTLMAGTVELRQAIAAKLERENGLVYAMNEIIATSGAKSAIYSAFSITLEPGDEVIVPAPYWVSYPDMVLASDGMPVIVACPEANDFKITPAQLDAAITPKTRWLLINSPNNPTGASYTLDEYRALGDVLARHPHVLVMTGWRIGYVAGPRDLVQALDTLLSQSTGNCCSISQAAAAAALNGDQRFVTESVAIYKQRRDAALARINAIPGLSCRAPDGAFYLYINCAGLIGKTTPQGKALHEDGDVVMNLLDSVGVAVVAGTAYGLSPYFRLSIATSIEILEEGCARIAGAVAALR